MLALGTLALIEDREAARLVREDDAASGNEEGLRGKKSSCPPLNSKDASPRFFSPSA
jgi:hypothetical protein